MVLLVAAAGVGNAQGGVIKVGNIEWRYEQIGTTKTCKIEPKDKNAIGTKVDIPEAVNDLTVTDIEDGAFANCSGLKEVTIPGSVTKIGRRAFANCSGLKEVTIPSSVTEIDWFAFSGCSGLTSVTIPDGVTEIGMWAFKGCIGLTAVTISGSVKEIGWKVFSGCSGLNAVYWLADANCTVDDVAFDGIASPATLYVRKGEKAKIERNGQKWWGKFTIVEGYVVTFQDGEGNKLGEQLVGLDSTANESKAPTKEGYTIVQWQLDGAKYDFETPVTKDITLVAVLEEVGKYKVTFDANGGTPTPNAQTVKEGKAATAPTAPTKDGYTFVEWQLDGAKYDFNTKVTQDIKLVAVWKKNEGSTPSNPEDPNDPKTAVESVQLAGVRVVKNPVGDALELEGMECAARVEVYSVVGARVHAEALRGEPRVAIDARGWASGVYVVRVVASDGERTLRVVK